ncbi:MAG: hypothetical protein AB7N76_15950 [Planctomycetota bacterium]
MGAPGPEPTAPEPVARPSWLPGARDLRLALLRAFGLGVPLYLFFCHEAGWSWRWSIGAALFALIGAAVSLIGSFAATRPRTTRNRLQVMGLVWTTAFVGLVASTFQYAYTVAALREGSAARGLEAVVAVLLEMRARDLWTMTWVTAYLAASFVVLAEFRVDDEDRDDPFAPLLLFGFLTLPVVFLLCWPWGLAVVVERLAWPRRPDRAPPDPPGGAEGSER